MLLFTNGPIAQFRFLWDTVPLIKKAAVPITINKLQIMVGCRLLNATCWETKCINHLQESTKRINHGQKKKKKKKTLQFKLNDNMGNPAAVNFLIGHTLRMRKWGKRAQSDFFGSKSLPPQVHRAHGQRVEEVESQLKASTPLFISYEMETMFASILPVYPTTILQLRLLVFSVISHCGKVCSNKRGVKQKVSVHFQETIGLLGKRVTPSQHPCWHGSRCNPEAPTWLPSIRCVLPRQSETVEPR